MEQLTLTQEILVSFYITGFLVSLICILAYELEDRGLRRILKDTFPILIFCIGWPVIFCIFLWEEVLPKITKRIKSKYKEARWRMENRFDPFAGVDERIYDILKAEKETEAVDKKIENLHYDPFD